MIAVGRSVMELQATARRARREIVMAVADAEGGHDAVVRSAAATGRVITVEEHTVIGGLGGAVAEVLSERYPTPIRRLGIRDTYGESGPNDALLEKYQLSAASVAGDVVTSLSEWPAERPRPAGTADGRGDIRNTLSPAGPGESSAVEDRPNHLNLAEDRDGWRHIV